MINIIQLKELHEKAIKKERLTEEDKKLLLVYQISQVNYNCKHKPFLIIKFILTGNPSSSDQKSYKTSGAKEQ